MHTAAKQPLRKTGLSCPKCGCRDLRAYYTRAKRDYILRKRICRHCGHEVITRERIGA
jgi:transcriptional regulator NrdR family protein